MATGPEITLTTTVREVMQIRPQAEAVFNKHGLTGCGGPRGPLEPIGFFATVHHVDPAALLAELNALPHDAPLEPAGVRQPAEQPDIYRPFVKAALLTVVTVGCTLGAINLAAMALAGVTGSHWEAITQAHGHAQIFGWAGLFIMGVSYHVLPRLKATQLRGRGLALASFWLMIAAISLRMVAQPFADSPSFAGIVVLSAAGEMVAASFFVYVVIRTLASNSAQADFWDKYVVASALWFWVSAAATLAISLYTASRGLAVIPVSLDAPYLHVALIGFVTMMVLGITLRTVPVFMGLRTPNPGTFNVIFWALNLSIVLKAGSGWADAVTGSTLSQIAGPLGSALEYPSILAFVYFLGVLGHPQRNISEEGASRNYEKFVRAAYFWLLVAGTMSAAYAAYQVANGASVPHSLVGAYRHALTVGFISMIIMGMAARIIPVFTGVRLYSDLMLLASFVLLNAGNALRVVSQPLADAAGGPFFVTMGVSGFIEVTGLALFVFNLWRTIDSPVEETVPVASHSGAITGDMIVANVLAANPAALDILVDRGFSQLRSPIGRRTLARAVTLEEACRMKGVDLQDLLRELNSGRVPAQGGKPPTDVPSSTPAAGSVSRELVTMALRSCYDPEIPVNVVDLGLVRDVQIAAGRVKVLMTLTAPGCPMGDQMVNEVRDALSQVPGVKEAVVNLIFDPPWSPEIMSDEAREQLGIKIA